MFCGESFVNVLAIKRTGCMQLTLSSLVNKEISLLMYFC